MPRAAEALSEPAGDAVELRLRDPGRRYRAVRLRSDLGVYAYRRAPGGWTLRLPLPPVARLEYELELERAGGGVETVRDPGNPRRAPGAFGEKSLLLMPGYRPPQWLETEGEPGSVEGLSVRGRGLRASVEVRLWSPAGAAASDPLPLLVANDGPEYEELSSLTRYAAAAIRSGALPPHRVALLAPGERDEWYSASAAYARALCADVLPSLRREVAVAGAPVGMGASLGGLAMLHAHRRYPGALGGLFLQSGSFFTPRFDAHEGWLPRFQRIVRFVRATLRASAYDDPVPTVMTCGFAEENIDNNRAMAGALAAQGYPLALHELADLHNYTAWRDAFHPHLTALLAAVW